MHCDQLLVEQLQEEFDAKIAFAYYHERSPLQVTTEMVVNSNGGLETHHELFQTIALKHDASNTDWEWVEQTLA